METTAVESNGMSGRKPYYFLTAILAAFLLPLVFATSSATFTFAVLATLVVWFSVRWKELTNLRSRARLPEVGLGALLIVANVARNFVTGIPVSFGLFDMLVAFIGLSIIFYGFAGFRRLWVPLVYILVLVSAYQLEFIAEEVQTLEFFLAQLMTMSMNALGIKATLFTPQNVVQLYTPYGPYLLEIAGPCTGVKGMLAYGSLAVLMLLDEKASAKRKLAIALIGVAGTMLVNIMRLNVIFLVIYALGIDVGLFVHTYLGYTLFLAWVMIFWTVAFQHLGPRPTSPMMRHGANTSPSLTR